MGEVEQPERVDRRMDADVSWAEGVRRLGEQEVEKIAEHARRRLDVGRAAGDRADVRDDDPRGVRLARDLHGNVRRQAAVDEHVLITGDRREDDRNCRARPHRLGEITAPQDNRGARLHVGRHGDEGRRQAAKVSGRGNVRVKQQLIEQRVDVALAGGRALQPDRRAGLLDNERRRLSDDWRCEITARDESHGWIPAEELLEGQPPDE